MTHPFEHHATGLEPPATQNHARRRGGWHVARSSRVYLLARHWPARFDVQACATFPPLRRGRLAAQIRQDLWRRFRDLRGFSPVIRITGQGEALCVCAGGRLMAGRAPDGLAEAIAELLHAPDLRARWQRHASLEGLC